METLGAQCKCGVDVILTDREIKIALERKQITIDPLPDEATSYQSTAVDLTLSPIVRLFKEGVSGIHFDPGSEEYDYTAVIDMVTTREELTAPFTLLPQTLLLAWTKETVSIPNNSRLAARVEGRSSLARLGVGIHLTAPTIHAGFSGTIQLEIVNHGLASVILRPEMRICQLIFEMTLGTPTKGYSGQFLGQQT